MTVQIRLDRLLGRRVLAKNSRAVGRIEELRAERRGSGWVIVAFVIGPAGLLERLGLGMHRLVGRRLTTGFLARWDQIDVRDPERPRLRCAVGDLERLE